jgi:dihydrofolate synthase/folylpolyglutamate synthase
MSVAPALRLEQRRPGRIRPDLSSLREALAKLGNPQDGFESVLIVGTNGKGSTASMLDAILREHGMVTGLFTSPHLVDVEERIRIGGARVDGADLSRQLDRLARFPDLTYFETLTAAAFCVFAERAIDIAVLEAGMGGSWDATRLAASEIAGLTNVGTDHRSWLGDARSEIARDKGRALAAARFGVIAADLEPTDVAGLCAPAARIATSIVHRRMSDDGRVRFTWTGGGEADVRITLPGRHQVANAQLALALAVTVVEAGWLSHLDPTRVVRALETVRWPGRLSVHRVAGREVTIDCAHNLEAAHALASYLDGCDRRYNLVFSCLEDKPVEEMAAVLRPRVDAVVVCSLADDRAMGVDRIRAAFPGAATAPSPLAALKIAPDPVLAAGSVRLAGALLSDSDDGGGRP